MKVRTLKRRTMAKIAYAVRVQWTRPWVGTFTPVQKAAELLEPITYTVARKKDGVVVGTYTTIVEAETVIAKAKASKKATLVIA